MSTSSTEDLLTEIPVSTTTRGVSVAPFADAVLAGADDPTDYVTCYVMNDNATAGTLDASQLPAGSYMAPSGGTLVMISGSAASVQTALRALLFDPGEVAAGTTETAKLTIVLSGEIDGASYDRVIENSVVVSHGINVALEGVSTKLSLTDEQGTSILSGVSVVSDGSDPVSVTLALGNDSLGSFDTSGVVDVAVSRDTDGDVVISGSASAVSAALGTVLFTPTPQLDGSISRNTVTVTVVDTVNGTTQSAEMNLTISGTEPALSLASEITETELQGGETVAPFSDVVINDLVNETVTATMTVSGDDVGSFDAASLAGLGSVTARLSADGDTLVLQGRAGVMQAAVRQVRFTAENPQSGTTTESITLVVSGGYNSVSTTETLRIASSGSAPAVSNTGSVSVAGGVTLLYPEVTITGPTTTVVATITLSDVSMATFDQARFEHAEAVGSGVGYGFSADGATLRISGSTESVTQALRSVALVRTTPVAEIRSHEAATLVVSAYSGTTSATTAIAVSGPSLLPATLSVAIDDTSIAAETPSTPFADATLSDPNVGDTVTIVVTSSIAGVFDAGSLASNARLSSDGASVTVTGSSSAALAALQQISVRIPSGYQGSTIGFDLTVSNSAGTVTLSSATATQALSVTAPPFSSNTGSDTTATVFVVGADADTTASIDLSDNTNGEIVVFGGNAALDLVARNAVIVLNGENQDGDATIRSLGNNAVWLGAGAVDYTAGGHGRFILGSADGTSSVLTVHGGTAADTNEFDVWGGESELHTIVTDGVSTSTVFSGGARLDLTTGNATVVTNGDGQTGAVTLHSLGGNTVWAGTASLDLYEGSGDDIIVLTGRSATTIHGTADATTGTTTVMTLSGSGSLVYEGGGKEADLSLSGGSHTVYGGDAAQSIHMAGGGSLLVSDDADDTGTQQVIMQADSTASLRFIGGGNAATLVLGSGTADIDAAGAITLTGGSGAATIDLTDAVSASLSFDGALSGMIEVTGFDPTRGSVQLSHVTGSAVQDGDLVVAFSGGASITFADYDDAAHAGISFV